MKRIFTPLRIIGVAVILFVLFGLYSTMPVQRKGLVIYASVGAAEVIANAFTRETGIPTIVIPLSTGSLLARISSEAHNPRWSLAWFEGDGAAEALDRMHLLDTGHAPSPDWTDFGRSMQPVDGAYTITGYTLSGVLLYRKSRGAAPPADWPTLIAQEETRLNGGTPCGSGLCSIGLADTALSGPAYPLLAGLLDAGGGWPQGQNLVHRALKTGVGMFPSNPTVVMAVRSRELDVGVVQSSAGYALIAKDPAFAVVVPQPAIVLPSVIMASADIPDAMKDQARKFQDFVMQPRIQKLRMQQHTGDHLFWPVTRSVVQPDLPVLPDTQLLHLDPHLWGSRQNDVIAWFEQEVMAP